MTYGETSPNLTLEKDKALDYSDSTAPTRQKRSENSDFETEQSHMPDIGQLNFDERFTLLLDREDMDRRNKAFQNRVRKAKFKENACVEDLDFDPIRGLSKTNVLNFISGDWIKGHQNIIISGSTGAGKTYLACAIAQAACRCGYTVKYVRIPRFLRSLEVARNDGSYDKMLQDLQKTDLILFDDFGQAKLQLEEARDLLEVMDDRHGQRSAIITSQLESSKWYELIPDPTIADALLDRIIHRSHLINVKGPSMRKTKSGLTKGAKSTNRTLASLRSDRPKENCPASPECLSVLTEIRTRNRVCLNDGGGTSEAGVQPSRANCMQTLSTEQYSPFLRSISRSPFIMVNLHPAAFFRRGRFVQMNRKIFGTPPSGRPTRT
jgi:DNA replication protein DnaC